MMAKTQNAIIKSFMKSLDKTSKSGVDALNEAIQACSNSKFTTIQSVIEQMVSDCQNAESADDFLQNKCGIILDNKDTGAITGEDAGNTTIKTAISVVPESGEVTSFTGNSFTTNGVTFQLASMEDWSSISYYSLDSNQKFIWQALYTWWARESLNLISDSYGTNFGFTSKSSATTKKIYFGFFSTVSGTGAYTAWSSPSTEFKTAERIAMAVNTYNFQGLDTTRNPNGKSTGGYFKDYYLDRTIAHELTHAVMVANINYCTNLPQFIKEGMAELTHGADDVRTSTIESLAADPTSLKSALNVYDTSTGTVNCYAAGYMFLRYLAYQLGNKARNIDVYTNSTLISGTAYADTIKSGGKKVTINGEAGNDYIYTYSDATNVTINGGAGKDTIESNATKAVIDAGDGYDYVYLYGDTTSKVTVNGGAGKDKIHVGGSSTKIYGDSGSDYIRAYSNNKTSTIKGGAGYDTIYGAGNKVKIYGESGRDYIYLFNDDKYVTVSGGTGSDTIESGGNKVKIYGDEGKDYIYLFTDAQNTTVDGGSGYDEIYVGGTKTSINGGAGKDYIHLYEQASKTTVSGGTGNDTIKSYSTGKVTYLYADGDGKDLIDGFNFGTDKLKITSGSITKTTYSGNDVIFKIGSGSIRIKDGRGETITITNAENKTTKKTYGISTGSKGVETYYKTTEAALTSEGQSTTANVATASSSIVSSNMTSNSVAETWFTADDTNYVLPDDANLDSTRKYAISAPPDPDLTSIGVNTTSEIRYAVTAAPSNSSYNSANFNEL